MESSPNAFAMAVPPTPLSPPVAVKGDLPSVVLADAKPAAEHLPIHASPTVIMPHPSDDDDIDELKMKRASKVPVAIVLGVLLAGGIGAAVLLGSFSKDTSPVTPAAIATAAQAPPATTPAATPAPSPPPVAVPAVELPAPNEAPPVNKAAPAEDTPPPKPKVAPREEPIVPRTPVAAALPPPRPAPASKPAAPAPKPAAPGKPSGGIVREVPF